MGFHLPGPTKGKVEHLIATYGAARISKPPEAFHDIPESKALICVVDTVTYETATYCYSRLPYGCSRRTITPSDGAHLPERPLP
jgi:hypothetical protein